MHFITSLFGRLHPLLVHLPIGFLFLAFVFECLSAAQAYRSLRKAVQPSLLLGSAFAIASALSGYLLRQEGGYEERLANLHQNLGISTAIVALAVYIVRPLMKKWIADPIKRKRARILLLVPVIVLLSLTGHFGGSLTHGEDYLFSVAMQATERPDPAVRIRAIASVPDAILYRDVIQPILESRCYDCHSSAKEKGDLRLDKEEFIQKGGKHGPVIEAGPADSSAIFRRLMLPLEDEHHMPPEEKPQLTSSEIALIKYWIEGSARFDQPVARFTSGKKIAGIVKSMQETHESWVPDDEGRPADEEGLQKLAAAGITPLPLADNSNYLMVTFAGITDVNDAQLSSLEAVRDQLVWLNLNYTSLTDNQMDAVSKLRNLRVLYLNNTQITDAGVAKLSALSGLRILSLVGTTVTDQSLPVLAGFKELTNVFLYQTGVSQEGIEKLTGGNEDLQVDTGNYVLQALPTDTIVFHQNTAQ